MWLADKGCGETIERVWQASFAGAKNTKVMRKIESCGKKLTRCSRNYFGNVRKELEKKRKELAQVERLALHGRCNSADGYPKRDKFSYG